MSQYWSPDVHALHPYVPGEQPAVPDLIKLNTNESPYPPAPGVAAAVHAAVDDLRLYPEPDSAALRNSLAQYHRVAGEQVFVGNGSDEVLAHCFRALFQHAQPLLCPDISYSFYPVYAGLFGVPTRTVPLDADLQIDPDGFAGQCGGVIFPNPNAPTGCLMALDAVAAIAERNAHCAVVVDEAYIDFGGESAIALLPRCPNVLVVRTFSKSRALAGMRVGYAVGSAELIDGLTRVKDSFNSYPLDRLAHAAALASVADDAHFQANCARVVRDREQLAASLADLGFETLPSAANFLFTRHPAHRGAALAAALRDRHILVRHFDKPRIADHLRISVGSGNECAVLVAALADIV
ncbi:MAG: histidinol-phosphate transaminase [Pseudomonadota bacterium]